jgi:amino acid adenylation domain-containing protein
MSDDPKPAALSPEQRTLLTLRLRQRRESAPRKSLIPRAETGGVYPLSFEQEQLWFINQLDAASTMHHLNHTFRLAGTNDAALAQTIDELVRRHEILRTTFVVRGGRPHQIVAPARPGMLAILDLRETDEHEREPRALRLATEQARRPFDLAQGPLFRASLLRLTDETALLLLTLHHIVTDWWSFKILFKELTVLYRAFASGRPSPLAELPIQFGDFAVWQQQQLQGATLEGLLSYWKQQLAAAPPLLKLPTDRPRPPVQTSRGIRQHFSLPRNLYDACESLSRREGVTLFTTLLAVFQTLLHRYTAQVDILVGTPSAGRTRAELEGLIGFFLNTLVLRADLSGNPRFADLLAQLRRVVNDAHAHEELPFQKLVAALQPQRSLSHTPLIQVNFIYLAGQPHTVDSLGADEPAGVLPGQAAGGLHVPHIASEFDLSLTLEVTPRGFDGFVEYNTELFESATITRMIEHLHKLMDAVVADPSRRVSDFEFLSETEQRKLLVEWNDTADAYSQEQCLHELFEAQARRTPEAWAVTSDGARLSYRELNERANQLAHHLRASGVGPEMLVGICVERSPEMIVGLLGILKAGAAYVPLDHAYPPERLSYMVAHAGARVILTQTHLAKSLSQHGVRLILLDGDAGGWAQENKDNPSSGAAAENLCYTIYTSGSTGRPKGVAVSHRSVVNLLQSVQRRPGLSARDRLLGVTSLSFDIAALEIYLPLIAGARLVLATRAVAADAGKLHALLRDSGASVMQATPTTWRMLLDAGWQARPPFKVLCGGETMPAALAHDLSNGGAHVWNLYGPTETTIWSSVAEIDAADRVVTIGRPLANTQAYILDAHLQPVPPGVAGELYIGGAGVARGYLNQPALTAETFIPHPFGADAGARLYRTGDVARHLPDGRIEYLGRVDSQVKVRGHRIELGEIESALSRLAAVREAVAVAREDGAENKYLIAYVVGDGGQPPPVSELRAELQKSLPDYMIPSRFVSLARLPLTPNGKVDRKALPAPDDARPELRAAYVAPRTEVERMLAGIWQEVLGVGQVGADDNFFDLGGHSLRLLQVQHRLHEVLGQELNVVEMFRYPTVGAMAAYLSGGRADSERNGQHDEALKRSETRLRLRGQRRPRSRSGEQDG